MFHRSLHPTDVLEFAVRAGKVFRPAISQAVSELDARERDELRRAIWDAQRDLASHDRPPSERLEGVRLRMEACPGFGAAWRAMTNGASSGVRGVATAGMLLGLVLDCLDASDQGQRRPA